MDSWWVELKKPLNPTRPNPTHLQLLYIQEIPNTNSQIEMSFFSLITSLQEQF